jgi:hypothetical protein
METILQVVAYVIVILFLGSLYDKSKTTTDAGYSAKSKTDKLYPPSGGSNVRKDD